MATNLAFIKGDVLLRPYTYSQIVLNNNISLGQDNLTQVLGIFAYFKVEKHITWARQLDLSSWYICILQSRERGEILHINASFVIIFNRQQQYYEFYAINYILAHKKILNPFSSILKTSLFLKITIRITLNKLTSQA